MGHCWYHLIYLPEQVPGNTDALVNILAIEVVILTWLLKWPQLFCELWVLREINFWSDDKSTLMNINFKTLLTIKKLFSWSSDVVDANLIKYLLIISCWLKIILLDHYNNITMSVQQAKALTIKDRSVFSYTFHEIVLQ